MKDINFLPIGFGDTGKMCITDKNKVTVIGEMRDTDEYKSYRKLVENAPNMLKLLRRLDKDDGVDIADIRQMCKKFEVPTLRPYTNVELLSFIQETHYIVHKVQRYNVDVLRVEFDHEGEANIIISSNYHDYDTPHREIGICREQLLDEYETFNGSILGVVLL